jgi:hypothetical protein
MLENKVRIPCKLLASLLILQYSFPLLPNLLPPPPNHCIPPLCLPLCLPLHLPLPLPLPLHLPLHLPLSLPLHLPHTITGMNKRKRVMMMSG